MEANCLNCNSRLQGPYCGQCGQSAQVHRYTVAGLMHDIPHAVFHVDRGIWPTLRGLMRAPGATVRAYLDGQRARYFNPLTLMVIAAALYVACYARSGFLWSMEAAFTRWLPAQPELVTLLEWVTRHYSLVLFLMVPPQALINWWCFRPAGRNGAEHAVALAFVYAAMTLQLVLLFPVLWLLTLLWPGVSAPWVAGLWVLGSMLALLYQNWAVADIFAVPGQRGSAHWRAQLAGLLGALPYAAAGFYAGVQSMRPPA